MIALFVIVVGLSILALWAGVQRDRLQAQVNILETDLKWARSDLSRSNAKAHEYEAFFGHLKEIANTKPHVRLRTVMLAEKLL